jgi:hypothetical protein
LKINKKSPQIFLVLVPHRDTRLILRKYSVALFKDGYRGAYSFPWVSPIAALSCPFTADELKNCAHILRESKKEKISTEGAATVEFLDNTTLFGPRLDLQIPPAAFDREKTSEKIVKVFSPSVIGTCLFTEAEGKPPIQQFTQPPLLSFRTAAVANMHWYSDEQDGAFYCKWEIGKLSWLPKADKAAKADKSVKTD